ncbi:MAG: hypothetical protein RIQ60_25 [Pseudomonadota bacterium]|jgi:hypothetical protein
MKSQLQVSAVDPIVKAISRSILMFKAWAGRSHRPSVSDLLVEVPLALAVISALVLASLTTPGV